MYPLSYTSHESCLNHDTDRYQSQFRSVRDTEFCHCCLRPAVVSLGESCRRGKMVCHQAESCLDALLRLVGDVSHLRSVVDSSGGDGVEVQIQGDKGIHPSHSPNSNPNMGRTLRHNPNRTTSSADNRTTNCMKVVSIRSTNYMSEQQLMHPNCQT